MISMLVLRIPYAALISMLVCVFSLIPIFGAFLACVVGMLLIAIESPHKAVIFLILFLVLQQIEGHFIYPHVVGNYVGLPGIWVLLAITVGGELFGIVGMIVFVPLSSVVYTLLKEQVNIRLKKKRITITD